MNTKGRIIQQCDSRAGHFWRPVDDKTYQCARCGECASEADFNAIEEHDAMDPAVNDALPGGASFCAVRVELLCYA
jgi:MinD superfamily P-loop ATPase